MEKILSKIDNLYQSHTKFKRVTQDELDNFGLNGITLRNYQVDGVNWLIERYHRDHGCILGDEMGLGKTCQTISFLVYLFGSTESKGPFLILSPLGVLRNWQNELARFAPNLDLITYVGNKDTREGPLRDMIRKKKQQLCVVLTTYEVLLKDEHFLKKYSWHTLIVDEAHRLKNRNSLLHQTLLDFDISHRILLTGTPVQNSLKELYSLLCFEAPSIFKEKYMEEFIETYSDVADNQDASDLHKLLKPFLLRRVKSEVVKDLPQKTELVLYHGMSALQKKYYKAILTKDMSVFENENQPTKTKLMNVLMQLRKCVNHPYLFDGVEPEPFQLGEHLVEASGKLVLLDQLFVYLKSKGHKVLVFSQMTRVLDILQDYLGYRGFTYERLDGSVRGEERYLAIQNFNEDDETFIFLLSTKAGGVGLNLVGADTVIFVDSDFNPQNDLQAAARAHRIGQTRPVKVIRMIGRSTVEEIILKRAEAKLKLTETVIEGGQFSLDSAKKEDLIADKNVKIQDILKFGVDRLFATDESTIEDIDFDKVLGSSRNGEWMDNEAEMQASLAESEVAMDMNEIGESMYMFEGKDYSKEPSAADIDMFDQLLQAEKEIMEQGTSDGRALRKTKTSLLPGFLPEPSRKLRKELTDEDKEERRKKREEAAARRAKMEEEQEIKKAQLKKKRREALWKENGYSSCNISLDSEGEEESDQEDMVAVGDSVDDDDVPSNHRQIHYVVGDVTQPQNTDSKDAFIVHCLDDSGSWGTGGLFTAISARSTQPDEHYTLAGQMKDLALGDAHLVPLEDGQSRESGCDYLLLIVAQHRDKRGNLSGIKLSALSQALKRICKAAKQMKASVHLPRIGHNTPGFNWYGTERLVRKHLALKGIPTYIYYFPRKNKMKRKQTTIQSTASSSEMDAPSTSRDENSSPRPAMKKKRSSSSQDSSGCPSLPVFMSGVRVFFHEMEPALIKKLTRYLVAYDGEVQKSVKEDTTHIVVKDSTVNGNELEEGWCDRVKEGNLKCVQHDWLLECFEAKSKVSEGKWTILNESK